MKKVLKALLVFCAVCCLMPALACNQKQSGNMTGGACSISELNNLEKNNVVEKRSNLPLAKRNLRPVRLTTSMSRSGGIGCLFGVCMYKTLLEEESGTK